MTAIPGTNKGPEPVPPRPRRSIRSVLPAAVIIIAFISLVTIHLIEKRKNGSEQYVSTLPKKDYSNVTVKKLERADVIRISGDQVIRLDGIIPVDSDEYYPWVGFGVSRKDLKYLSKGAMAVMKNIIDMTISVRVEFTPRGKDRKNRLYAKVYAKTLMLGNRVLVERDIFTDLGDNKYEIFLNGYLVRMGYARVEPDLPRRQMKRVLEKMENRARIENLGVWKMRKK